MRTETDSLGQVRVPEDALWGAQTQRAVQNFPISGLEQPRIYLTTTARALAFLRRRGFVIPEDIKELAPDVLRHRIITTFNAEAAGITSDEVVRRLLAEIRPAVEDAVA